MQQTRDIKIAIIDLNNGKENLGLNSLICIIKEFSNTQNITYVIEIFELRNKGQIPGLDFDLFFSTGGPGSPYEGLGKKWEADFFNLLDMIDEHNANNDSKKYCFLICHSFQLACLKYKIGKITRRDSTAFGVYPIQLTKEGCNHYIFEGLPPIFYSVDSRNWQVTQPNSFIWDQEKVSLLALESEMLNQGKDRCMMAIQFSREMIGVQFHPEAQSAGVAAYLEKPELKKLIIENHGLEAYQKMVAEIDEPDNLQLTQSKIIPNFLLNSTQTIVSQCHD